MSAGENKAVFLSYASQDAAAVLRIAEALRAAGLVVWFDKDELVGGDAWDAKIRKQIKECALFVPVISANTNARAEGYFRLEWKLAVDRSHLMADDALFLFPVVIDETSDAAARVPDRFREVQWTRLSVKDTPETLAVRVGKLLGGGDADVGASPEAARGQSGRGRATPLQNKNSSWMKNAGMIGGILIGLVYAIRGAFESPRAREPRPAAVAPVPAPRPAPVSEARQLAARARAMSLDKYNSTADDYAAAEGLLKRALELDANDGELWAVSSLFNTAVRTRGFDNAPVRREAARSQAERALKLAPESVEGRFALARWQRDNEPDPAVAEATFKEVLARAPEHAGALGSLATHYQRTGRFAEAIAMFERVARVPGHLPLARYNEFLAYFGRSQLAEAERCVRESIAAEPSANSVAGLAMLLLTRQGEAGAAVRALAAVPAANRNEHRVVWMSAFAQLAARAPDEALKTLERLSADFIQDNWFVGPKAYWVGRAHAQAGRPEAARLAFEAGLAVTAARLKETPGSHSLRATHGELLAWLGRTDEALREARTVAELERPGFAIWISSRARIFAVLGRADDALPLLAGLTPPKAEVDYGWPLTPALLRVDPLWDKLRGDARFQALAAGAEKDAAAAPAAQPDQKSVAVLAFANLSDEKGNEYFSDGISEELLNVLAKIPELKVSARTSAFSFKGKNVPIPEIAQQLGVAYVIEGSVRKAGDKVRITAQLIKAADGFHVWSDTFTRDLKDIFAVQDEIAGLIARNFQLKLGAPIAPRTVNPEAYALLLQGRAIFNRGIPGDYPQGLRFYKDSLAIDGDSSLAWASLSVGYAVAAAQGVGSVESGFGLAREAASRAVALEGDLAQAHYAQGLVHFLVDWDWPKAEASIQRALALAPNEVNALGTAATIAQTLGDAERALSLARKAVELDPLAFSPAYSLAKSFYQTGRYTELEKHAERMIAVNPGGRYGYFFLTLSHLLQGRTAAAALAMEPMKPDLFQLLAVTLVRHAQGRRAESDAALAEMEAKFAAHGSYQIAEAHAYRNQPDRAFEWLEKGYRDHDPGLTWLTYDPLLGSLRTDERWPVLLKRMNLPITPAK